MDATKFIFVRAFFVFYLIFVHGESETLFPSEDDCGEISISGRVFGGAPIKAGKYPWLAAIGYLEDTFVYGCGGSVITKRYVITAANCFDNPGSKFPTHVRVGDLDILSDFDPYDALELADTYNILEYIKHPDYNKTTRRNDIALIRTDRNIVFNDHVKPGCLPFNLRESVFNSGKVQFVGWGQKTDAYSDRISPWPYGSQISVFNMTKCERSWRYRSYKPGEKQICYGTVTASPCTKDEGSPLMKLDKRTSKLVIIGVHSYDKCSYNSGGQNSIGTNVVDFLPWINETVRQ